MVTSNDQIEPLILNAFWEGALLFGILFGMLGTVLGASIFKYMYENTIVSERKALNAAKLRYEKLNMTFPAR